MYFPEWLADPGVSGVAALAAAVTATLTAIFTGYSAILQWKDRRQTVSAEWRERWFHGELHLEISVTNNTTGIVDGDRAIVRGPISEILAGFGSISGKNPSWSKSSAPAYGDISPGETRVAYIRVSFAPAILRRQCNRWRHYPGYRLSRAAWHLGHWSIPSGTPVTVALLVRRRSSSMRPIRLTHTIRINAPTGQQIAATIEATAQTTKAP